MACRCVKRLINKPKGNIVRDDLVILTTPKSAQQYPEPMRRVTAWVLVDGEWMLMTFLTNNLKWSANTISELYRCRWPIETFFRQIKQTLKPMKESSIWERLTGVTALVLASKTRSVTTNWRRNIDKVRDSVFDEV